MRATDVDDDVVSDQPAVDSEQGRLCDDWRSNDCHRLWRKNVSQDFVAVVVVERETDDHLHVNQTLTRPSACQSINHLANQTIYAESKQERKVLWSDGAGRRPLAYLLYYRPTVSPTSATCA